MNLDETCIRCFESHSKGNVFGKRGERSSPVAQRLAKKLRKKCLTYIAMICNHREIQSLLPQYIIGNEHTFLKRDLKRLGDACGANIVLVRRVAHCGADARCLRSCVSGQKSGGTDAKLTAAVLRHLAKAVLHLRTEFEVVVLMDALRAHLATPVLDVFSRWNMLPCIVPSGMTDKMQPLDTHAFSQFKNALREKYSAARGVHPCGDVPMHAFVGCIIDTISQNMIFRNWSSAFLQNGFGRGQSSVSQPLLPLFGNSTVEERNVTPTLSQLELCLGRRAQAPAAIIWRRFVHNAAKSESCGFAPPVPRIKRKLTDERNARIVSASSFGKTRSQTAALRDAASESR